MLRISRQVLPPLAALALLAPTAALAEPSKPFADCKSGDARACTRLAYEVEPYDLAEAQSIADEACKRGSDEACQFAVIHANRELKTRGGYSDALKYLDGRCHGGDTPACRRARSVRFTVAGLISTAWMLTAAFLWIAFRRRDRVPVRPTPYPGLIQLATILVAVAVLGVSMSLTLSMLPGAKGVSEVLLIDLLELLAWPLVLLLASRHTGAPVAESFRIARFPLRQVPVLLIAGVGLSITLSELDNVLRALMPLPNLIPRDVLAEIRAGSPGALVLLALIAPLSEELLLRGLFLRAYLAHHTATRAICVSAAIFALIHLNPPQIPAALFSGLFLGWLAVKSESVLPAIIVHAALNACVFSGPFVRVRGYSGEPVPGVFQPWWFDVIGAGLVALSIVLVGREFRKKPATTATSEAAANPPTEFRDAA